MNDNPKDHTFPPAKPYSPTAVVDAFMEAFVSLVTQRVIGELQKQMDTERNET